MPTYRAHFHLHEYSLSKFVNAGHKIKVINNVYEEVYCV